MAVVVCLVVIILLALLLRGRGRSDDRTTPQPAPHADARRAAIVVNPTKFDDVDTVRSLVMSVCAQEGWAEPIWLETTKDDPGTGQARDAIAQGADLVCALGGDGTVRAVAAALIDDEVPMGLLPGGTGNLLARNLELPVDDIAAALRVALTGKDLAIDVGTVHIRPDQTQDDERDYFFLVMAGMRHLGDKRFTVDARIDDGPPFRRHVRTVVVGNVGRLQGGVELLPDAQVSDGELDVVMLSPKGLVGWASVSAAILTRNRRGHNRVEHHRCHTMALRLAATQEIQLDGDPIGPGHALRFAVRPSALTVRVG